MKRKRKRKMHYPMPLCLWDIVVEMTKWSAHRGAALGAVYGFVIYLLAITDFYRSSIIGSLCGALIVALPFGAVWGCVAGIILGLLDGFLIAVFTWILTTPPRNWNAYRISISIGSVLITFVAGEFVFNSIEFLESWFLHLAVTPALIAAITLGYRSQKVAGWYLWAVSTNDSVEAINWFRW